MVSLMPFYLPNITSGVCISNFASVFLSGQNTVRYRKVVSIKRILPILLSYCFSNTIIIILFSNVKNEILKMILGIFLICYGIVFLFEWFKFKFKRSVKNGIIAGLISGILGGLFGTGGPPISIYLLQSSGDVSTYQADIQLYFTLANIYSLIIRLIYHQINTKVLIFVLIAIPATVIGAVLGKIMLKKNDSKSLAKFLYAFLIVNGFILLFFN